MHIRSLRFVLARALMGAAGVAVVSAPAAAASELPATPSTLESVVRAAQGGDVVVLASGSYSLNGVSKPAMITLRPQPGAAVTMRARFTPASNITLQAMTVSDLKISGPSKNIVVRGNRFTGQADLNVTDNPHSGIVIDGNTFDGITACGNCPEGRLQVSAYPRGSEPSEVIVRNNHFGGGGESDGIQIGAQGVIVGPGNVFEDIKQGGYDRHVDALQLYGQGGTTIIGNYFRNNTTAIMAPDGGNGERVMHNVIESINSTNAVQFGSWDNSTFIHNTVRGTSVNMDHKPSDPPSRGGVIRDNVMVNASFRASSSVCEDCTIDHNLFSGGGASGTNAIVGTPRFVGGGSPTTYEGWRLAAGSPGKASASDGADRGIALSFAGPPSQPPAQPGGSARQRGPKVKLKVAKRIRIGKLRHGLRLRISSRAKIRVAVRLRRKGAKKSVVRFTGNRLRKGTRRMKLRPPARRLRSARKSLARRPVMVLRLRVRATTRSGATTVLHRKIRVVR